MHLRLGPVGYGGDNVSIGSRESSVIWDCFGDSMEKGVFGEADEAREAPEMILVRIAADGRLVKK
jgi:hypothetical protein